MQVLKIGAGHITILLSGSHFYLTNDHMIGMTISM